MSITITSDTNPNGLESIITSEQMEYLVDRIATTGDMILALDVDLKKSFDSYYTEEFQLYKFIDTLTDRLLKFRVEIDQLNMREADKLNEFIESLSPEARAALEV
ncbi:hypothetical protein CJU90_5294 [Yarrowia sp. C11]|nr:hypothetical protein CKK34_6831 [Yarrowia sp. E02]KAG5359474.1 hypothetical protein CJU90_5294 [Yarrowia sp. C11]